VDRSNERKTMDRHQDVDGQLERKHNNTKVRTLRKTYPGFAEGKIRSDATLGTLKEKLGLPQEASLNDVREELKG
jgi:hypothetical protein